MLPVSETTAGSGHLHALSLSPSLPAALWGPVPRKRPGLGHLTPWPVFSIQLILSVLSLLLGEMA